MNQSDKEFFAAMNIEVTEIEDITPAKIEVESRKLNNGGELKMEKINPEIDAERVALGEALFDKYVNKVGIAKVDGKFEAGLVRAVAIATDKSTGKHTLLLCVEIDKEELVSVEESDFLVVNLEGF